MNRQGNSVEVLLEYPAYEFGYPIEAEARGAEIVLSVNFAVNAVDDLLNGTVTGSQQ